MTDTEVERFQKAAHEISSFLKSKLDGSNKIRINTDTDPDGLTAGSIFAMCMSHYDVPFHISFRGPPEEKDIEKLGNQDYDLFVFIDQGSEQFSYIEKHLLENNHEALVLDHHPGKIEKRPGLTFLNPHEFDLNGAKDVSAAGVVYSVVEKINDRFKPYCKLALIGATGDRQELPSGFTGVNKYIAQIAIENNIVSSRDGLKLDERKLPIPKSISRSVRPFLTGLSGNEKAANNIIKDLGIDPNSSLEELGLEDEKKISEKILKEIEVEPTEKLKQTLWGKVYILPEENGPSTIHEYVTILDACEKLNKAEVGFSALLGDKSSKEEAKKILGRYKERMIEAVSWFNSNKKRIKITEQMRYIYVKDEIDVNMLSEALSIALESGLIKYDRPVLGLVNLEGKRLKISARAPSEYSKSGGNIGAAMREVSKELGGCGGGHDVAAAARISLERKDEFIKKIDKFLENENLN